MSEKELENNEHIIEKTKTKFYNTRAFRLNFIAFLIGIVGALAAYGFKSLVNLIRSFSTYFDNIMISAGSPGPIPIFILLIVAAAITGPIIKKWAPEAKGHGVPEVIEAVEMKQGIIRLRVPFVKAGVSGISIGAGMSLGAEGPIVQIAGGVASFTAQKFKLKASDTKLLVVCGVSAGISAIFTAPIGGILFGIEAILMTVSITSIIPLIFSSLISAVLGQVLMGSEPIFSLLDLNVNELLPFSIIKSELWIYIILGIVAGCGGIIYQFVLYFAEDKVFGKLRIPFTVKLIIGAILVGCVAIGFPEVLGTGYENIKVFLTYNTFDDFNPSNNFLKVFAGSNPITIIILGSLILFLMKLIATSLSIGSGASGGIFAPGLFLGAALGAMVGGILHSLFSIQTPIGMCALFGMAGVFGGAARVPFTMIIMTAELTGAYFVFLPLMITVFISYWINESVNKYSIYTKKLANRGINLQREELNEYLENFPIVDVMSRDIIALSENITVAEAIEAAQIYRFHGYPVIDNLGILRGTITLDDMYKAQLKGETNQLVGKNISCPPELFITPFESVKTAIDRMFTNGIGRLPVVRSNSEKVVVGIVTERDVINVMESQNLRLTKERMKKQEEISSEMSKIEDLVLLKDSIMKKRVKHLHSIVINPSKGKGERIPKKTVKVTRTQTMRNKLKQFWNNFTKMLAKKDKKTVE